MSLLATLATLLQCGALSLLARKTDSARSLAEVERLANQKRLFGELPLLFFLSDNILRKRFNENFEIK